MHVCVVDDDAATRNLLSTLLRWHGYEVVTVCDGVEAVDFLIAASEPWVVLMDVMMPRLSGPEACHQLMVSGAGTWHRVGLMTAGEFDEQTCPALVRLLVHKPFDLKTILAAITSLGRADGDNRVAACTPVPSQATADPRTC